MGCICSKAITRSMSIREELSHGFQSKSTTWEELLTSHSGNDQLFAFVCSSNTMTTKLRTSSFSLPSGDPQTVVETKYLANAWDVIPDIKGKAEVESGPDAIGQPDFGRFTRSKSCQIPREKEMLWLSPETDVLNENKLDWKDKNLTGSRSFHTVEDYDALLERIHKLSARSTESFEDYYSWADVKLQESNSLDDQNQNDRYTQGTCKDFLMKKPGIKEGLNLDHEGSNSSLINSDNFENVVQVDGARETGWKRKAVAKGLKSLDVSTIEFPNIARFKQRIHVEGQVYSPGTYITPKFGSYNAPATQEKKGEGNSVFSPELVAAFEDCMQQLQVDEDSILRHMNGYSPADDEMENEVVSSMKHGN